MSVSKNKQIAIKVIKEEFPGISQQGINALLANIEIETRFTKFVEIPQDYNKVMANPDLVSMQKNLRTLVGGKAEYDKLTDKEKLGVLYQGDKDAKYAGGIGGLQLTAANYGGLQDFEKDLNQIANTLNVTPEDLYNKAKTDPETAIRLSLVHLRDIKNVDVQKLNFTDGKSLRKTYINPGETQGVETSAQSARDTIFNRYDLDGPEQFAPTAEEAAGRPDYSGDNPRLREAQKFLTDYVEIEKSDLNEADKIKAIADLFKTSPGAKYAIPEYVQGVARTPVGNTGMQDVNIEKLREGVVDTDPDYLLGLNLKRGNPTLKRLVTKIRRDLNRQGSSEILNRAYKTDQMFKGVPASKLFDKIPEWSNQEGADMSLNPTDLDPLIIAQQTPLTLDERLLQEEPITLEPIRPGQTKEEQAKIINPIELDIEDDDIEEEQEVVSIDLSKRKQKKAIREAKNKENKLFGFLKNAKLGLGDVSQAMNAAGFALSAGAGLMSIAEAREKDTVTKSQVDPLFTEAVNKVRAASEMGMPYEQRQAAMKDINNAYVGAMKNVMSISGGQRGLALANVGVVDANRLNSLVDLASKDSDMRQKNLELFAKTSAEYSNQKLTADMNFQKLKSTLDMNRKNRLADIGGGLLEQAQQYGANYTATRMADKLMDKENDADRVQNAVNTYLQNNPAYIQSFTNELAGIDQNNNLDKND